MKQALEQWLRQLDSAPLECDGLTRCISTLLTRHEIEHVVHQGVVDVQGVGAMNPHYWIEMHDGQLIDLRARMWLGQKPLVPHGLFSPGQGVEYRSSQLIYSEDFEISDTLFHILSGFELDSFSSTQPNNRESQCNQPQQPAPPHKTSPSELPKARSECAPGF